MSTKQGASGGRRGKTDIYSKSVRCCSCWQWNRVRVAPRDVISPGYDLVKLSENRILRVRHVNPQPRDAAFESELQEFICNDSDSCLDTSSSHQNICSAEHSGASSVNNSPSHPSGVSLTRTKSAGPVRSTRASTAAHQTPTHLSHSQQTDETRARIERTHTATSVIVDIPNQIHSPVHRTSLSTVRDGKEDIQLVPNPDEHSTPSPRKHFNKPQIIFMLHGVGGSSDVWQAQIDYFQDQGFELVVPDFLGHGFSSAPKDSKAYTFKALAQDMLEIFDKYCKRRSVLIGHSYGSSFACYLARERSHLISHLILISGGSPTPLAPQPGIFQWPVCCLECCRPLLKRIFGKHAFQSDVTYIPKEKAFDVPAYVLKHTMNGQNWPEGSFEYHSLISTSTLLIHGEQDQLIGIEDEEEMLMAIPGSKLIIISEASHMVMIEQPDVVNTLIHDFMRNAPS